MASTSSYSIPTQYTMVGQPRQENLFGLPKQTLQRPAFHLGTDTL